jgi:hypothetical protein
MKRLFVLLILSLLILSISCSKADLIDTPDSALPTGSLSNEVLGATVVANYTPVYWSDLMIANVSTDNNIYNNTHDSVTWTGYNGFSAYRCETDCSGLLTCLLKQSYGYTNAYFKTWTGLSNPYAATYYNEIKAKDHFTQIPLIKDIARGDIIAIKYPAGSSNTGHIMIVASTPTARTASSPLVSGTSQYEVTIMDASSSGHGSLDTRYISSGNFNDGIGRGIARLYVTSKGTISGYTWSTYSNSVYYSQSDRPLLVGRLNP